MQVKQRRQRTISSIWAGPFSAPDGGHRLGNMLFDFRMVPFCFFVVQTVGSFAGDGSFSGFGRLMECAGKRSFVVEILLL